MISTQLQFQPLVIIVINFLECFTFDIDNSTLMLNFFFALAYRKTISTELSGYFLKFLCVAQIKMIFGNFGRLQCRPLMLIPLVSYQSFLQILYRYIAGVKSSTDTVTDCGTPFSVLILCQALFDLISVAQFAQKLWRSTVICSLTDCSHNEVKSVFVVYKT